jgi:hypothetical protein
MVRIRSGGLVWFLATIEWTAAETPFSGEQIAWKLSGTEAGLRRLPVNAADLAERDINFGAQGCHWTVQGLPATLMLSRQ